MATIRPWASLSSRARSSPGGAKSCHPVLSMPSSRRRGCPRMTRRAGRCGPLIAVLHALVDHTAGIDKPLPLAPRSPEPENPPVYERWRKGWDPCGFAVTGIAFLSRPPGTQTGLILARAMPPADVSRPAFDPARCTCPPQSFARRCQTGHIDQIERSSRNQALQRLPLRRISHRR